MPTNIRSSGLADCLKFLQGRCSDEDYNCPFRHYEGHTTEFCREFDESEGSYCPRGHHCPHRHSLTRQIPCAAFERGRCDKRSFECFYKHDRRRVVKEPVCRHYLRGRCVFTAEECQYGHPDLYDEDERMSDVYEDRRTGTKRPYPHSPPSPRWREAGRERRGHSAERLTRRRYEDQMREEKTSQEAFNYDNRHRHSQRSPSSRRHIRIHIEQNELRKGRDVREYFYTSYRPSLNEFKNARAPSSKASSPEPMPPAKRTNHWQNSMPLKGADTPFTEEPSHWKIAGKFSPRAHANWEREVEHPHAKSAERKSTFPQAARNSPNRASALGEVRKYKAEREQTEKFARVDFMDIDTSNEESEISSGQASSNKVSAKMHSRVTGNRKLSSKVQSLNVQDSMPVYTIAQRAMDDWDINTGRDWQLPIS